MKVKYLIGILAGVVLLNIAVLPLTIRWDLTADKRYSLSEPTRALLDTAPYPIEAEILLAGNLPYGLARLGKTTREMLEEMSQYADIRISMREVTDSTVPAYEYTERLNDGRTIIQQTFPYVRFVSNKHEVYVPLLVQQKYQTQEQNMEQSIQQVEFALANGLIQVWREHATTIAFVVGHGELSRMYSYDDIINNLELYYRVGGVELIPESDLSIYDALIIADPRTPFSEQEKYLLDQYVMRGGNILWAVNGAMYNDTLWMSQGFTPILPQDLNLTDMLFRYGVRFNPTMVMDLQCKQQMVSVSKDPQQPNWQPLQWTFSPLLMPTGNSFTTSLNMPVACDFVSTIDTVGGGGELHKQVLLATSNASREIRTPNELYLMDYTRNPQIFTESNLPVAMAVEGRFASLFAHRLPPEGIIDNGEKLKESAPARQVMVGSGSLLRTLTGMDMQRRMRYGNADFVADVMLWLTRDDQRMALRPLAHKSVQIRLINDRRAHAYRLTIQLVTTLLPVLILVLIALTVWIVRIRCFALKTNS